jgi:zona occludens toxin (predicted ATPase)
VGKDVDVWHYVNFCDDEFFKDPLKAFWWEKFPVKAVIIIDEVHKYLSRSMDFGSMDLETALINWISTHRHQQQEIYFLSQHTDQFANAALGIADKLLEIVNIKSLKLPFPISISMEDIEVLKESFGIKAQYYQANHGNFRGKRVVWGGAPDRLLMSEDIFKVYKSHDAGVEESDRPSLKMTRIEALLWFGRRHGLHLGLKLGFLIFLLFLLPSIFLGLPNKVMAAMQKKNEANKPAVIEKESDKKALEPLSKPVVAPAPVPLAPQVSRPAAAPPGVSQELPAPVVKPEPLRSKTIVMLFVKGVMLDDGSKYKVGETFDYDGSSETLAMACAVCGVVIFESGKRKRF